MKLFFKIVLLLLFAMTFKANVATARPIIYITHQNHPALAQEIKRIIVTEQHVPDKFVTIDKKARPCATNEKPLLWLCIDEQGQIKEMMKSPIIYSGRLAIKKGK